MAWQMTVIFLVLFLPPLIFLMGRAPRRFLGELADEDEGLLKFVKAICRAMFFGVWTFSSASFYVNDLFKDLSAAPTLAQGWELHLTDHSPVINLVLIAFFGWYTWTYVKEVDQARELI